MAKEKYTQRGKYKYDERGEKVDEQKEPRAEARYKAKSFFERRKDRANRGSNPKGGEPKGIRMGRENDGKGHRR